MICKILVFLTNISLTKVVYIDTISFTKLCCIKQRYLRNKILLYSPALSHLQYYIFIVCTNTIALTKFWCIHLHYLISIVLRNPTLCSGIIPLQNFVVYTKPILLTKFHGIDEHYLPDKGLLNTPTLPYLRNSVVCTYTFSFQKFCCIYRYYFPYKILSYTPTLSPLQISVVYTDTNLQNSAVLKPTISLTKFCCIHQYYLTYKIVLFTPTLSFLQNSVLYTDTISLMYSGVCTDTILFTKLSPDTCRHLSTLSSLQISLTKFYCIHQYYLLTKFCCIHRHCLPYRTYRHSLAYKVGILQTEICLV